MDIYNVPILISGILCSLLAVVTWLFRRRESINRVFSFFALTLAIDGFAYFSWFQFGSVDHIQTWMRATFIVGFLVPVGLIYFFLAYTGYDTKLNEKVLGIKVGHFKIAVLLVVFSSALLSLTELFFIVPDVPDDLWDFEEGVLIKYLFIIFLGIFLYLAALAYKSYKSAQERPRKRFILLVSWGTFIWICSGYFIAILLQDSHVVLYSVNYLGTAIMAIFFFVAILNYQSDKVYELNINLERKVEERTRHLKETRAQLIQSEKMAAMGHLVAGVAHEMNTPVGAVHSAHETMALATEKLKQTLENEYGIAISDSKKVSRVLNVISSGSGVIRTSSERITDIVKRLKTFAQLDEAELQSVDFNGCVENTLAMFQFHLKSEISIRKEFADLPMVTCYPAKINQLCFQLLRNANQAISDAGEIVLRTEIRGDEIRFSVSDDGRGMSSAEIEKIFDPGYTAWDLKVGTGLGLAICYQVSQDHNGRIEVESAIGKGSTFTFSLPVNHQT
jgi:signal transduction histidine kinase